jgi:hypothetical protein
VAVLFVEQSGQVLTVAVEKRNETMAAQGAVDLADYVELLRCVGRLYSPCVCGSLCSHRGVRRRWP